MIQGEQAVVCPCVTAVFSDGVSLTYMLDVPLLCLPIFERKKRWIDEGINQSRDSSLSMAYT